MDTYYVFRFTLKTRENIQWILQQKSLSRLYKKILLKQKPFSRRTVHRWMLKLGCKCEEVTVSYYTDTHEVEETKRDMKER
jgi:hypothetical protein